jgi:hypothetical protein
MSEPDRQPPNPETEPHAFEENHSSGPNLTLIYSLIALALFAAIGFAMMIVLPFHRRH